MQAARIDLLTTDNCAGYCDSAGARIAYNRCEFPRGAKFAIVADVNQFSVRSRRCIVTLDCFDEYVKLLTNFSSLRLKAAEMAEVSKDEFVRIAQLGFSSHCTPSAWHERHAEIIAETPGP